MSVFPECKKMKRSGFFPALLLGGLFSAMVPVLNMAFRSELYTSQGKPPVRILLDANWQMMAMLNILLVLVGTCILYHTEYENHAIGKMAALPIKRGKLFVDKFLLMAAACIVILALEAAAVGFCSFRWFPLPEGFHGLILELLQNFGCFLLLMMPAVLLSLFIASVCENMWISLGIGVICVFTATMLPSGNFALSLFPYALLFQIPESLPAHTAGKLLLAVPIEIGAIGIAGALFANIRRRFT